MIPPLSLYTPIIQNKNLIVLFEYYSNFFYKVEIIIDETIDRYTISYSDKLSIIIGRKCRLNDLAKNIDEIVDFYKHDNMMNDFIQNNTIYTRIQQLRIDIDTYQQNGSIQSNTIQPFVCTNSKQKNAYYGHMIITTWLATISLFAEKKIAHEIKIKNTDQYLYPYIMKYKDHTDIKRKCENIFGFIAQYRSSFDEKDWGTMNDIVDGKMHCAYASILSSIFLEKLSIQHKRVASEDHVALLVSIDKDNQYIFDTKKYDTMKKTETISTKGGYITIMGEDNTTLGSFYQGDSSKRFPSILTNIGSHAVFQKQYNTALYSYFQAIVWGGLYPAAMNGLGHCFSELKKDIYALRCFVYLDTHNTTIKTQNNIIATMLNMGQYRKAKNYIKTLPQTDHNNPKRIVYINEINNHYLGDK